MNTFGLTWMARTIYTSEISAFCYSLVDFLAHLSRRFKWAIAITICPASVRFSVC